LVKMSMRQPVIEKELAMAMSPIARVITPQAPPLS